MRKIFPIILMLFLLTSCMTSYTVNSKTEKTPISIGMGGSYIHHIRSTGFGYGFNIDIAFEFFESETSSDFMTFRMGPNIEYERLIFSMDFNVKYKKIPSTEGSIAYTSAYNYMSLGIGYAVMDLFHVGVDFNAKKEFTIFCRLLYKDNS